MIVFEAGKFDEIAVNKIKKIKYKDSEHSSMYANIIYDIELDIIPPTYSHIYLVRSFENNYAEEIPGAPSIQPALSA